MNVPTESESEYIIQIKITTKPEKKFYRFTVRKLVFIIITDKIKIRTKCIGTSEKCLDQKVERQLKTQLLYDYDYEEK